MQIGECARNLKSSLPVTSAELVSQGWHSLTRTCSAREIWLHKSLEANDCLGNSNSINSKHLFLTHTVYRQPGGVIKVQ